MRWMDLSVCNFHSPELLRYFDVIFETSLPHFNVNCRRMLTLALLLSAPNEVCALCVQVKASIYPILDTTHFSFTLLPAGTMLSGASSACLRCSPRT